MATAVSWEMILPAAKFPKNDWALAAIVPATMPVPLNPSNGAKNGVAKPPVRYMAPAPRPLTIIAAKSPIFKLKIEIEQILLHSWTKKEHYEKVINFT